MKKVYLFFIGFSLFLAACSSTGAAGGGWQFLGDQNVNLVIDHDELVLGNSKDDFRQIRLHISDGPVHIINLKIHFDNDEVQDVPLQTVIKSGQQSKIIRLDGGLRRINKITFWYNTVGFFNGKSKVAVWGSR